MLRASLLVAATLSASLTCQDFSFLPKADYDPQIPSLQRVVGHAFGERISSHAETVRYLEALAAASPRASLVRYGESWEGRGLHYLVIGSPERIAALDAIKRDMQTLADPRALDAARIDALVGTLPAVTWLAYSVHGDEISCTDAALLTAYHLLAARDDEIATAALQDALVIIDPLENPDGRDRFVHHYRQTRGRWPDADPQSAEHNQPWPGGRTNHYLFDMNRDWFALTQPESRARVRAFLEWFPLVYVDLHEMGSNSTYYFPPPAPPLNPQFSESQVKWLETFGRNNARWFDAMGFAYFTSQVFDAFYPGYGEGWPMFHGAIGMTYEQASVRGLVVDREDDTTLHYRQSVQQHFVASLATIETAAKNRTELLRSFAAFRREAADPNTGAHEFLLPPGRDPGRTEKLVGLLLAQGVEVLRATDAFRATGTATEPLSDHHGGAVESREFPAGTWIVRAAQPARRLVETLMARRQEIDEAFLAAERERRDKRQRSEIYDVTAWSLPLLFEVECYRSPRRSEVASQRVETLEPRRGRVERKGDARTVAYAIAWGTQAAARALAEIFRADLRVFCSDKSFRLQGVNFPAGSLVLRARNNPEDLGASLERIAAATGATIHASPTTWVEEGISLGSNDVRYLVRPKIALAWHRPTSPYSAGWSRYVLEQAYGYPVTIVHARQLGTADLAEYDVIVLPDARGGYGETLGKSIPRLESWIKDGGTLVSFGEATHWLTGEKVGLLPSKREFKNGAGKKKPDDKSAEKKPEAGAGADPEAEEKKKPQRDAPPEPFDLRKATQPDEELPDPTPGAIVRVDLDPDHWLAFGYRDHADVLVSGRNIFTPIKLDVGRNVGVYAKQDELLRSGLIWPETEEQLAQKAYLVHRPLGKGHVVAFAQDPNYRAMCDGLNLLFLNAVFFGPGH